ncbi:hypothetical protein QBE52_06010 [Clostridiaceae bacterium 35-E11]
MDKVFVAFDQDIPRYACTFCYHCQSIWGKSLCTIKNRGCCWYYPKFTLLDIQRMVKSIDGLQVLEHIRQQPGTVIHSYIIHAKGSFDQQLYDHDLAKGQLLGEGTVEDQTIFYRTCPFVLEGSGCTLPPRFRTIVCNFFICSDILENPILQDQFKPYIEERSRYAKWVEWENLSLKHALMENQINLAENFQDVIKLLQELALNIYAFPSLIPVELENNWMQGA